MGIVDPEPEEIIPIQEEKEYDTTIFDNIPLAEPVIEKTKPVTQTPTTTPKLDEIIPIHQEKQTDEIIPIHEEKQETLNENIPPEGAKGYGAPKSKPRNIISKEEQNANIPIDTEKSINEDIEPITPIHSETEEELIPKTMNIIPKDEPSNIDETYKMRDEIFENLDHNSEELTPEEIEYFNQLEKEFDDNITASKTADMKIKLTNKGEDAKAYPLDENEELPNRVLTKDKNDLEKIRERNTEKLFTRESIQKNNKPKTSKKPRLHRKTSKPTGKTMHVTIKDTEYDLKSGMSIIYNYKGEAYESRIHTIDQENNINVTYRRQKIWSKASDIKKVF